MTWHRVADVRSFLSDKGQRRVRPNHDMTRQILNWRCCKHCGLLGLKNEATRKALNAECVTWEDGR